MVASRKRTMNNEFQHGEPIAASCHTVTLQRFLLNPCSMWCFEHPRITGNYLSTAFAIVCNCMLLVPS
jgi:hypothetical protein